MIFDERLEAVQIIRMAGTGAIAPDTLDNEACSQVNLDKVLLNIDGHTFLTSDDPVNYPAVMNISGTVNYDGMRAIMAVGANDITILSPYKAEVIPGTAVIRPNLVVGQNIRIVQVELHLSDAGAAENFTITKKLRSLGVNYWDTLLYSEDTDSITDILWVPEKSIIVPCDSMLEFAFANTNARTWGLQIYFVTGH